MRFRPRARAVRNGIVTGVLIIMLGAVNDAWAMSAGPQAGSSWPLWSMLFGVSLLLFAGAGYATTRRAGTLMMGGLAGSLAGFIEGIGFAVTWALSVALAAHAQVGSLLVTAGVSALYGVFFVAPIGTGLGALLGMLGAHIAIACCRASAARGERGIGAV